MKDLTDADFVAWPNFHRTELACKCGCGQCCMVPSFMDILQSIRLEFNKPLALTSGYRCPGHNSAVSHTGDNGPHTSGAAVDVAVSGADAIHLLAIALRHGIHGIGVSQKGSSRFLHLDLAPINPRPAIWSY